MRDIVKPFIESLGATFVSDEQLPDGYRARIEKDGQTAAVVITNAQIEVLIALQLDDILEAWRKEGAAFQDKVLKLQDTVRDVLSKKKFKGRKTHCGLGDGFAVDFEAGGELRHVHFTAAEMAAHSADALAAMVEDRVNRA